MNSDTGDSTRAIYDRINDAMWQIVLPLLRRGGTLQRDSVTRLYYVDGRGGLTEGRITRLERAGTLRRVGADTYALAGEG